MPRFRVGDVVHGGTLGFAVRITRIDARSVQSIRHTPPPRDPKHPSPVTHTLEEFTEWVNLKRDGKKWADVKS